MEENNNKTDERLCLEIEHYNAMTAYYTAKALLLQTEEHMQLVEENIQLKNMEKNIKK